MYPIIDILMAVYNNEEYLAAQLQSLMEQTYSHFHIIVRDDCSTDRSIEIIQEIRRHHPEKITFIKGAKNLGACGNFAALMQEAKGEYIMFCDADDVWHATKVEESLALMKKNEAIYGRATPLLVHTDLTVVDKHLDILSPSFWNYSQLNPQLAKHLNRLLTHNVITGCTSLINKALLQLASPIPQEAIMHDWWLGLVASAFGQVDYLPKATMLYRQHGKNDTGAKNWKSMATYWLYAQKALTSRGRKELHQRLLKTIQQAARFLQRHGEDLHPNQRCIVQHYVALSQAHALKKRYLFLKYRYFKNTWMKNLSLFLFL